jgi:hypothetical protein
MVQGIVLIFAFSIFSLTWSDILYAYIDRITMIDAKLQHQNVKVQKRNLWHLNVAV